MNTNAIEAGLVTWAQATFWFQSFFNGSNYLIPIFCTSTDTLDSVISRITAQTPTLEKIQAITVMAGYTENGMLLVALALRFAMQLRLEDTVEQLMVKLSPRTAPISEEEKYLYRLARVWHGVCNLELFFSLDGGKMPATVLRTTSRRVRALVNHPSRTSPDIRLLSQLELNILRSHAYVNIARHARDLDESSLRSTVRDTVIELSLWLEEWSTIICSDTAAPDRPRAMTNLQIQYEWALITLYLKALSVFGDLLMTDFQREMVRSAKEAAVRHLQHLLETPSTPSSPNALSPSQPPSPTYLSTFKWAIDFVWAKCAFSVLLVLKLSLLLRDPLPSIILLLRDAHQVLEELHKITVGHVAYFHILQTSVEKCEGALKEHMARLGQASGAGEVELGGRGDAEDDFQEYAPSEFVFEWDFPGLNLRHVPLGWYALSGYRVGVLAGRSSKTPCLTSLSLKCSGISSWLEHLLHPLPWIVNITLTLYLYL
ncbi:hypothetical protein SLS60_007755 [Paraconiothyrium brasiliense]|uniref:Uncharacterized protein n=1 Tax=Paraconiothyrium brasiliense TaxID=300254 RepID=A0ABR3R2F9_9PLEO